MRETVPIFILFRTGPARIFTSAGPVADGAACQLTSLDRMFAGWWRCGRGLGSCWAVGEGSQNRPPDDPEKDLADSDAGGEA